MVHLVSVNCTYVSLSTSTHLPMTSAIVLHVTMPRPRESIAHAHRR